MVLLLDVQPRFGWERHVHAVCVLTSTEPCATTASISRCTPPLHCIIHRSIAAPTPEEERATAEADPPLQTPLQTSRSVHTLTLTETRPLQQVELKAEFQEAMDRCPQWVTPDIITRCACAG